MRFHCTECLGWKLEKSQAPEEILDADSVVYVVVSEYDEVCKGCAAKRRRLIEKIIRLRAELAELCQERAILEIAELCVVLETVKEGEV